MARVGFVGDVTQDQLGGTTALEEGYVTAQSLGELWRCPECEGALTVVPFSREGGRVEAGLLRCGCGRAYPVIRGIPRLFRGAWRSVGEFLARYERQLADERLRLAETELTDTPDPVLERTRQSFGFQWTRFGEMVCDFEENFLHYVHPLEPAFFRNKRGLDAGCGFGRHLYNAAKLGAEMVGIDLSVAIDVSDRHTAGLRHVCLAQADIYHLPLEPESFDFVYAIGVLHHLPDPEAAFHCLVRAVKPGGTIAIWVYSKHRRLTRWLLEAVRRVTIHLPHAWVKGLSLVAASVEWSGLIRPYQWLRRLPRLGPWSERWILQRVKVYAGYPFQVSYADWFDRLAAPIRFYYHPEELRGWFQRAGLEEPVVSSTGNYGWRAVAVKPVASDVRAASEAAWMAPTR